MSAEDVVVLVEIKSLAEHRGQLIELLGEIIERSRIAPDCYAYEMFGQADDENTFFLFQTWGSREAYETNWTYSDVPRINANSKFLKEPIRSWELQTLL